MARNFLIDINLQQYHKQIASNYKRKEINPHICGEGLFLRPVNVNQYVEPDKVPVGSLHLATTRRPSTRHNNNALFMNMNWVGGSRKWERIRYSDVTLTVIQHLMTYEPNAAVEYCKWLSNTLRGLPLHKVLKFSEPGEGYDVGRGPMETPIIKFYKCIVNAIIHQETKGQYGWFNGNAIQAYLMGVQSIYGDDCDKALMYGVDTYGSLYGELVSQISRVMDAHEKMVNKDKPKDIDFSQLIEFTSVMSVREMAEVLVKHLENKLANRDLDQANELKQIQWLKETRAAIATKLATHTQTVTRSLDNYDQDIAEREAKLTNDVSVSEDIRALLLYNVTTGE